MFGPKISQELVFVPDASTAHSVAYFPRSLNGLYQELTVYVVYTTNSNAGKIQIQTAPMVNPPDGAPYGGTWASVGSTIDYAAANAVKYASVTGVFADLRLDIDTAVGGGGTVRAWVVASAT